MAPTTTALSGVELLGTPLAEAEEILSADALAFVAELTRAFRPRIRERLAARAKRQAELDGGARLAFLEETRAVREGDWRISPLSLIHI